MQESSSSGSFTWTISRGSDFMNSGNSILLMWGEGSGSRSIYTGSPAWLFALKVGSFSILK